MGVMGVKISVMGCCEILSMVYEKVSLKGQMEQHRIRHLACPSKHHWGQSFAIGPMIQGVGALLFSELNYNS